MRPLLVTSLMAIVLVLSACGGTYADRITRSAKGWDTPFVRIKPIRRSEPPPNVAGGPTPGGRMALTQVAYSQMPGAIDPGAFVEPETAPGPSGDSVEAAATTHAATPEAAILAASAASAIDDGQQASTALPTTVLQGATVVVAASTARKASAEAALEDWYASRHVDLMPRSDWAR